MSVFIKGMKMPSEGEYHMTLYVCSDGSAYIDVASFPVDGDRFEAVPVPPHGDLIDRDKLEKDIDKYIGGEESRSRFHHWVQVQRAVIPESEEAHT